MSKKVAVDELADLQTEARNPTALHLDTLSPLDLAKALHSENHTVAESVEAVLPEIGIALAVIGARLKTSGRLFYIGAGTSGRLGVLDASECPPTFGVPKDMVQGIIAGGDFALRNSIEGAEDDPSAGAAEITTRGITNNDVVVGIAASGRTPFVVGALQEARAREAYTIALVNTSPSILEQTADLTIAAITGAESVTGSTRLKAGTAQKMVLNLLSTGTMILLGKTYENLMVDLRATNTKLRDRAQRIVMEAAGVDRNMALGALERSDWSAKTAIVSLISDVTPSEAKQRLDRANGFVGKAIAQ